MLSILKEARDARKERERLAEERRRCEYFALHNAFLGGYPQEHFSMKLDPPTHFYSGGRLSTKNQFRIAQVDPRAESQSEQGTVSVHMLSTINPHPSSL